MVEEALALAHTLDVLHVPHVHRVVAVDTRDLLLRVVVRDGDRLRVVCVSRRRLQVTVVNQTMTSMVELAGRNSLVLHHFGSNK